MAHFNPVLTSTAKVSALVEFIRGDDRVYLDCQGQPVLDDTGALIGVLNVTSDTTELMNWQVYAEIEQQINFLSPLAGGMEDMLKKIFFRLCRLDYINFGGGYVMNDKTQTLELLFQCNFPDDFISRVKSFGRNTPQFEIVSKGVPQYDYLGQMPGNVQAFFHGMGIRSIAVIPLTNGEHILGSLNLASSSTKPFSESRRVFVEGIAWRIASIISLHKAQENLKDTVDVLNETISDLRIKQQMLIQKSKMESLGELSAGMAHEIYQPLMIISLSIENIQQKLNSEAADLSLSYLRKKFETIQLNVTRIQQIIENMRIFARDQSGILFEKVNIREVINKTFEMVNPRIKNEGIQLIREDASENIHILGNIFKLEQVFLNILSNSIYAVNKKMTCDNVNEYRKRIGIKVATGNDRVTIDLTDNGTGIPEDHLEKLFTPFFTTKREGGGTGLGLPIVYGIVKEMNGDIKVRSKVNEFTNVQLVFPMI
ncbi:MAG: ATP-binding protein [Bacteroidetes bacterium]|nr:ATP-binding protein [Bacteroidota bacterium]